jgi:hypothetical protein
LIGARLAAVGLAAVRYAAISRTGATGPSGAAGAATNIEAVPSELLLLPTTPTAGRRGGGSAGLAKAWARAAFAIQSVRWAGLPLHWGGDAQALIRTIAARGLGRLATRGRSAAALSAPSVATAADATGVSVIVVVPSAAARRGERESTQDKKGIRTRQRLVAHGTALRSKNTQIESS